MWSAVVCNKRVSPNPVALQCAEWLDKAGTCNTPQATAAERAHAGWVLAPSDWVCPHTAVGNVRSRCDMLCYAMLCQRVHI